VRAELASCQRYGRPLAIVTISLEPSVLANLRPRRQRELLRDVGNRIRNGVRLVDDVGRLDDGMFMLVLPCTEPAGAQIVANRISASVRSLLGVQDPMVSAEVLGSEKDLDAIRQLCGLPPAATETVQSRLAA
jgi:hypothetical protein